MFQINTNVDNDGECLGRLTHFLCLFFTSLTEEHLDEPVEETVSEMPVPDESKVSIRVDKASSEGASDAEENSGIFQPSEPAEDGDGDGADEDVTEGDTYDVDSGGNDDESGGNDVDLGGNEDEIGAYDVTSGANETLNEVEMEGISSEETEPLSEELGTFKISRRNLHFYVNRSNSIFYQFHRYLFAICPPSIRFLTQVTIYLSRI